MVTLIIRLWLPDRPGALGQVASRIGAVRGSVVGIDILERASGQAVDELAVELHDESLTDLLVDEINQVDGVAVEEVRVAAEGLRDPRLDALETAAVLVGATEVHDLLEAVVTHARRALGADWAAVIDLEEAEIVSAEGVVPSAGWLVAFVEGSRAAARDGGAVSSGPSDVVWAPLASAGLALVVGRDSTPYRARERHTVAALSRIVATRLTELSKMASLRLHPSAR